MKDSYLVVVRQDAPRIIGNNRLIGNKELFLLLSRRLPVRSAWIQEQSLNGLYLVIAAGNCSTLSKTANMQMKEKSHIPMRSLTAIPNFVVVGARAVIACG